MPHPHSPKELRKICSYLKILDCSNYHRKPATAKSTNNSNFITILSDLLSAAMISAFLPSSRIRGAKTSETLNVYLSITLIRVFSHLLWFLPMVDNYFMVGITAIPPGNCHFLKCFHTDNNIWWNRLLDRRWDIFIRTNADCQTVKADLQLIHSLKKCNIH